MSHVACIAFAPVRDVQRMNNTEWQLPGRTTYWPGSIQRIPGHEIPLVVDHDFPRVGTVTDIAEMDWEDGRWFCALADVTDTTCLRAGMGASFIFIPTAAHNDELGDRISHALLKEVTVCVLTQPVEPAARLVTLAARKKITEPTVIRRATPIHREDEEIAELRRRIDWHEAHRTGVTFEQIIEGMKRELRRRALRDVA